MERNEFDSWLKLSGHSWPGTFRDAAITVNDTMDTARRILTDQAAGSWTATDLVAVTRMILEEERRLREVGSGGDPDRDAERPLAEIEIG